MSQFALIYRQGERNLSPEELQQHLSACQDWFKDLIDRGSITDPGIPLGSDRSAVVGRQKVIYDGPFGEAKDVIGGFTLVEAVDLAAAVLVAQTCPIVEVGGVVEVRPVQGCTT